MYLAPLGDSILCKTIFKPINLDDKSTVVLGTYKNNFWEVQGVMKKDSAIIVMVQIKDKALTISTMSPQVCADMMASISSTKIETEPVSGPGDKIPPVTEEDFVIPEGDCAPPQEKQRPGSAPKIKLPMQMPFAVPGNKTKEEGRSMGEA